MCKLPYLAHTKIHNLNYIFYWIWYFCFHHYLIIVIINSWSIFNIAYYQQGSIEDSIRIKSEFSEQRIPIQLHFKDNDNNNNNNSQLLLERQRQEFEEKSEKVSYCYAYYFYRILCYYCYNYCYCYSLFIVIVVFDTHRRYCC